MRQKTVTPTKFKAERVGPPLLMDPVPMEDVMQTETCEGGCQTDVSVSQWKGAGVSPVNDVEVLMHQLATTIPGETDAAYEEVRKARTDVQRTMPFYRVPDHETHLSIHSTDDIELVRDLMRMTRDVRPGCADHGGQWARDCNMCAYEFRHSEIGRNMTIDDGQLRKEPSPYLMGPDGERLDPKLHRKYKIISKKKLIEVQQKALHDGEHVYQAASHYARQQNPNAPNKLIYVNPNWLVVVVTLKCSEHKRVLSLDHARTDLNDDDIVLSDEDQPDPLEIHTHLKRPVSKYPIAPDVCALAGENRERTWACSSSRHMMSREDYLNLFKAAREGAELSPHNALALSKFAFVHRDAWEAWHRCHGREGNCFMCIDQKLDRKTEFDELKGKKWKRAPYSFTYDHSRTHGSSLKKRLETVLDQAHGGRYTALQNLNYVKYEAMCHNFSFPLSLDDLLQFVLSNDGEKGAVYATLFDIQTKSRLTLFPDAVSDVERLYPSIRTATLGMFTLRNECDDPVFHPDPGSLRLKQLDVPAVAVFAALQEKSFHDSAFDDTFLYTKQPDDEAFVFEEGGVKYLPQAPPTIAHPMASTLTSRDTAPLLSPPNLLNYAKYDEMFDAWRRFAFSGGTDEDARAWHEWMKGGEEAELTTRIRDHVLKMAKNALYVASRNRRQNDRIDDFMREGEVLTAAFSLLVRLCESGETPTPAMMDHIHSVAKSCMDTLSGIRDTIASEKDDKEAHALFWASGGLRHMLDKITSMRTPSVTPPRPATPCGKPIEYPEEWSDEIQYPLHIMPYVHKKAWELYHASHGSGASCLYCAVEKEESRRAKEAKRAMKGSDEKKKKSVVPTTYEFEAHVATMEDMVECRINGRDSNLIRMNEGLAMNIEHALKALIGCRSRPVVARHVFDYLRRNCALMQWEFPLTLGQLVREYRYTFDGSSVNFAVFITYMYIQTHTQLQVNNGRRTLDNVAFEHLLPHLVKQTGMVNEHRIKFPPLPEPPRTDTVTQRCHTLSSRPTYDASTQCEPFLETLLSDTLHRFGERHGIGATYRKLNELRHLRLRGEYGPGAECSDPPPEVKVEVERPVGARVISNQDVLSQDAVRKLIAHFDSQKAQASQSKNKRPRVEMKPVARASGRRRGVPVQALEASLPADAVTDPDLPLNGDIPRKRIRFTNKKEVDKLRTLVETNGSFKSLPPPPPPGVKKKSTKKHDKRRHVYRYSFDGTQGCECSGGPVNVRGDTVLAALGDKAGGSPRLTGADVCCACSGDENARFNVELLVDASTKVNKVAEIRRSHNILVLPEVPLYKKAPFQQWLVSSALHMQRKRRGLKVDRGVLKQETVRTALSDMLTRTWLIGTNKKYEAQLEHNVLAAEMGGVTALSNILLHYKSVPNAIAEISSNIAV